MKPKLTVSEAKFVKAKIKGLSNTKAAMVATGTKSLSSAGTLGHRLSKKVNVQEAMAIALEKHNLTADRLAGVVNRSMDATKVVISGTGEEAFAEVQPDYGIQLKAVTIAAGFMGLNKQNDITPSVHFHQHMKSKKAEYDL